MSIELKNSKNTFQLKNIGWSIILNVAEKYGWVPLGTKKPKNFGLLKKWPGNYDSSDGQIVIKEDSLALSDSLKKFLQDSNNSNIYSKLIDDFQSMLEKAIGNPLGYDLDRNIDEKWFREITSFLEEGEFKIF